jgi:uncharacterized membrane protein HdeD (DUF308 family)
MTASTAQVKGAAEPKRDPAGRWWIFLITGVLWILVSFLVLSFDPTSAALIGYFAAFFLIAAGVNEFLTLAVTEGWRWLHGIAGAVFVVVGVLALFEPLQTFGILALLIGWYLLLKGTLTIVLSILGRDELPLWGLLLASGILELVIGIWAIGYPWRSAWLLILWVGIGAVIRGITEIVLAFQLRGARNQPA